MTGGPGTADSAAADLEAAWRDAVAAWAAARRRRLPGFIRQQFGFKGSLKRHRAAVGPDLLRSPANLFLGPGERLAQGAGDIARRLGAGGVLPRRLAQGRLRLETDLERDLAWRVTVEWLELPCRLGRRQSWRNALLDELLADPRVAGRLEQAGRLLAAADDAEFRARLDQALAGLGADHAAWGDIATGIAAATAGAVAFHKATPGALALGQAVAQAVTQHLAAASFPLGAAAGTAWQSLLPAKVSPWLLLGSSAGAIIGLGLASTFAGLALDPLRARLGLAERQLSRLIDGIEADLAGDGPLRLKVAGPSLQKLAEILDLTATAAGMVGWRAI